MFLKIAVLNNSGNVGKSMVCDTFLKPRLPGIEVIKIETINSDSTNDEKIPAKNIKQVFEKIDSVDAALIDVGSSNIETFMMNLSKLEGAHEDIDFFFIPTTPKPKQQVDTITTIQSLMELGVDIEQIKIIFNFNDPDLKTSEIYPIIFDSVLSKKLKLHKISNVFTISENPVFDMVGEMATNFTTILNDQRDFKALIRATQDKEQRAILSHQRSANRLAKGFEKELDLTFSKLFSACEITQEA